MSAPKFNIVSGVRNPGQDKLIRLTIEIDGKKFGVEYENTGGYPASEFGKVVEQTISYYRGHNFPLASPVLLDE